MARSRRRVLPASAFTQTPSSILYPSLMLPDDVLVCTLELLNLSDLRSAASVSRQFYAAAWRSGLHIHRKADDRNYFNRFIASKCDDPGREGDIWSELVDHALQKGHRVAFTVFWGYSNWMSTVSRLPLQRLLGIITKSLPILVSLSITVAEADFTDLCAALHDPAPCLRTLCLHAAPHRGVPGPIMPASGLFSGRAPLLRELGVDYRSLGLEQVPAFANVVRVLIRESRFGDPTRLPLARSFPALMHLMVSSEATEDYVPAPELDLSGVTLRSAVFHNLRSNCAPRIARSLDISNLPAFHCLFGSDIRTMRSEPLGWPSRDSGPSGSAIAMHVACRRGCANNIRYASSDGAWRRTYIGPICRGGIWGFPDIAPRLVFLRLEYTAVPGLTQCTVVFPKLRRLRIDAGFKKWHDYDETYRSTLNLINRGGLSEYRRERTRLQCPVLQSVAVLWNCPPPAEPVKLARVTLYVFGRALGTDALARPVLELGDTDGERPLELCDAPWVGSVGVQDVAAGIQEMFSAVRRVPCAYQVQLDQFGGDVWNDNAAIAEDKFLSQYLPW